MHDIHRKEINQKRARRRGNKKALSMATLAGIILLVAFLLIVLMAYNHMADAGTKLNTTLENNMSRLGDIAGGIE